MIAQAGFRAFPPRLAHQPIFYPVLNVEYATQIAREWNTQDENSGFAGFVTRFEVEAGYIGKFAVQVISPPHRPGDFVYCCCPVYRLDAAAASLCRGAAVLSAGVLCKS